MSALQEHALHLQDLRTAKAEAQHAEEEQATLHAEVHQLQMEINAKQVRSIGKRCRKFIRQKCFAAGLEHSTVRSHCFF